MSTSTTSCLPASACAPTKNIDWLTPIELSLLGAIWGASFLFMRVAAPEFGAFALVEVRLALGALVLLPFAWRVRAQIPSALWPKLAAIGAINSAVPFVLFAWSAQYAPAAVSAICNATTVLFAALVAYWLYGEKMGARRALALLTGFVGVVVLATSKGSGAGTLPAVIAATFAALLYGVGANMVKRHLTGLPAAAVAAATLSASALLLAPLAISQWPTHEISAASWWSAGALGMICTGFAFLVFYRLIQRNGAARATTATYLVPLFAAAWAWLVLGEAITPAMLFSGALILGSVAMSTLRAGNAEKGIGKADSGKP
jgi:drug/metabolite transporter (DMT)-like permease